MRACVRVCVCVCVRGKGKYAASQITLLYMKKLNKTESLIFVLLSVHPSVGIWINFD